jgi:mannosyl-glycoprotein endo-beta-N-acetylglucosaminidase
VRVSIADDGRGAGTQTDPYQVEEADAEDATFRCVSIPIQSVDVTPGRAYSVVLVFKLGNVEGMDVDVGLSARVTPIASGQGDGDEKSQWEVDVMPMANEEVDNGWTMLRIQVLLKSSAEDLTANSTSSISVDLGIIVGIAMEDPSQPLSTAVTLGLLTMHPSPEPAAAAYYPKLIWAAFESLSSPKAVESSTSADTTTPMVASTTSSSKFPGLLTWETGVAFAPPTSIPITSPEDPILAWTLADEPGWFPRFSYFNVYAIAISSTSATGADNTAANTGNAATSLTSLTPSPEEAHFVGTTGLDGRTNRLVIEESMFPLPTGQDGQGRVGGDGGDGWRWYVQGVTDHGEVVPWERCVFADHVM